MTVLVLDADLGSARCRWCGAEIVWALTPGGLPLAVDARPVPDGEVELYAEYFPDGEAVDGYQRVRAVPPSRPASSPAWSVHWGAPRPCARTIWPCRPARGR